MKKIDEIKEQIDIIMIRIKNQVSNVPGLDVLDKRFFTEEFELLQEKIDIIYKEKNK